MYKRILAPIDGSDASRRCLEEAVALAKDQGASLQLLFVIDASMRSIDTFAFLDRDELLGALRNTAQDVLGRGEQLALDRGVKVQTVLRESTDPRVSAAIVDEANKLDCNLIVMGTHGRRGLSHIVLGSDADAVVKSSPVPVLLVRPSAA